MGLEPPTGVGVKGLGELQPRQQTKQIADSEGRLSAHIPQVLREVDMELTRYRGWERGWVKFTNVPRTHQFAANVAAGR